MYRALYRKWRPQKFADVVGQEAITTALANQIINDKIGHAYIFTGTRGTGKTTCAKIFAKAANCEAREGAEPCGKCPMCLGLEDGSVLDVAEIDAASNNGVDDVRDLREETAFRPARGQYRVYIIDEVHMLSTAAFNALLKILEEPPGHVIFILATTEIHKVPATILSRCQRFDFIRIPAEKIAERLSFVAKEEAIPLTDGAADLVARLGDGSMRDALSLLDTCAGVGEEVNEELVRRMAGVADKSYLFEISDAAQNGDVAALLQLVDRLRNQSIDVRRLGEELIFHFRNLLLATANPDGSLLENVAVSERQQYLQAAGKTDEAAVIRAIRRLAAALDKMARSPDPRIELELALFDLGEGEAAPAAPIRPAAQPVPAAPQTAPVATPLAAPAPAPAPVVEEDRLPDARPKEEQADASAPDAATETVPKPQSVAVAAQQEETGGVVPFEHWAAVLAQMTSIDKMLSSYMSGTNAFTNGSHVLIDGGDVFMSYIRENDFARERIKTVIQQVSGKRYAIGPYEGAAKTAQKAEPTAQDTLKEWEAMGVQVTYMQDAET